MVGPAGLWLQGGIRHGAGHQGALGLSHEKLMLGHDAGPDQFIGRLTHSFTHSAWAVPVI